MGRKRKAGPQPGFAEVVERTLAESTGSVGPSVTFLSLIGEGEYVDERVRFLARIRPYVKGEHRERDDYTGFEVGEFKDDRRRSLIVVEESC